MSLYMPPIRLYLGGVRLYEKSWVYYYDSLQTAVVEAMTLATTRNTDILLYDERDRKPVGFVSPLFSVIKKEHAND